MNINLILIISLFLLHKEVVCNQQIAINQEQGTISNNTGSSSETLTSVVSTSHFPLEISTDNGGVLALLPSGKILVDERSSTSTSSASSSPQHQKNISGNLAVDVFADKLKKILSNETDNDQEEKDKGDEISPTNNEYSEEKRCSDTADNSPGTGIFTRDEPHHFHDELVAPREEELYIGKEGESIKLVGEGNQGDPSSKSSSRSMIRTQTSSSSVISEDPTFNSYAPSELSSMMSHMEIQYLLKQGRQQQDVRAQRAHDVMMGNISNSNTYNSGPPLDIVGRRRNGAGTSTNPTMTLYSNQSLYAPSMVESRSQEIGVSSLGESRKSSHESTSFPQTIQPAPSSSSNLLHRADAMLDEASVLSAPSVSLQEIQHSTPVRSQTSSSTTTSTVVTTESSTAGGEGLKVEFEVVAESSLDECYSKGNGDSYQRTISVSSSATEKKSVQSLLGTSTKSLADDLFPRDSDDEEDHEDCERSGLRGDFVDDADGYSADQSSVVYNLSAAHDISEYSIAGESFVSGNMELRKGVPMTFMSDDDTENSHVQNYGYGHMIDQEQPPRMMDYSSKHVMSSTLPSLADDTSALTEVTALSITPSAAVSANMNVRRRQSEKEEREDSLPPVPNTDNTQRSDDNGTNTISPQSDVVQHIDPLMATTSLTSVGNSTDYTQPIVTVHHHHAPAATPLVQSSDPRMNIDYERRYIVDLERINEESSNHDLRSGGTSNASSPRRGATTGRNLDLTDNEQLQLQQPKMLNRHPNHPKEFFDYRHQYYTEQLNEQYHYFDDRYSQASTNPEGGGDDEDTNSTCSSVTLSQAFHPSETDSCVSSISDEYSGSQSHSSPSLTSTCSSVTLSHALSADRHNHSGHGFYVATRLGDFVEVPTGSPTGGDVNNMNDVEDEVPFPAADAEYKSEDTHVEMAGEFTVDSSMGDSSTSRSSGTDDNEIDVLSDGTAIAGKADVNNKKSATQVSSTIAEDVAADILSTLVPECGVPSPSVMAKVGTTRPRSSRGGMLLPWHSTRSIQNYQGRRGSKKKGKNPMQSARSSPSSLYSISSVHTFRG